MRAWLQLQPKSPAQQHSYQGQPGVCTSIKLFSGDISCLPHALSLDKPGFRSRLPAALTERPSVLWSPTICTILNSQKLYPTLVDRLGCTLFQARAACLRLYVHTALDTQGPLLMKPPSMPYHKYTNTTCCTGVSSSHVPLPSTL